MKFQIDPNLNFVAVLDNIRSLENIGSIFRTGDALGLNKIYLCGISGSPPHPKISKTALGAENWIGWEKKWQTWRVIEELKNKGFQIVSLELAKDAIPYFKFSPKFPLALVVGNEIKGVSRSVLKRSDAKIYLPMLGRKESLNVAVAFGVAGFYINKYRIKEVLRK
jgi:tRNA G18 (ribose-2'-O)-methylase SpoU